MLRILANIFLQSRWVQVLVRRNKKIKRTHPRGLFEKSQRVRAMLKSRSYACLSCRRLWREAFESRATRKTTNECSIGLKQKENDSTVLLLHWYRNVSYGPLCLFSGTVLLCPVSKQYQSNIRRQTGRMSSYKCTSFPSFFPLS